ncbi:MAG: nucleotidyltransferase family protein, partial [Acidobacteriota bacterium]|nr:nucleotidyltransferase family protein [Acidobacteriota bacterium]
VLRPGTDLLPGDASTVSGVVLAAGSSKRFGGDTPKQLLEIGAEPLVRRTVASALGANLSEVIVVVGHRGADVRAALDGLAARIVENPRFSEGQSTSVATGLRAVDPRARAAMFIPCDQPFLTVAVLDALIAAFDRTGGPIVVPQHGGRRGAPVTFARALFAELEAIEGDVGGRSILPCHEDDIVTVELDNGQPLLDINTPEDYDGLKAT